MKRLTFGLLLQCVVWSASPQMIKAAVPRVAPPPVSPIPVPAPVAALSSDDAMLESARIAIDLSGVALRTGVDLTVSNPQSMPREATVNFPLAPGEQLARFALDVNGVMRTAVAVEKTRGREVFEAVERRRVDPALLEKTEGDNFRLRIFPVSPHGVRKARVDLVQIASGQELRIAPPSSALLAARSVEVHLHISSDTLPVVRLGSKTVKVVAEVGGFGAAIDATAWTSETPVVVLRDAAKGARIAIDDEATGHWLLADLPVTLGSSPRRVGGPVELLWDSSASHDRASAELEIAELDGYFKAMGNGEVRLQRLRNQPEPIEHYTVSHGNWDELREALRHTVYDGATALSDFTMSPDVSEYLLVSDGLSNYDLHPFPKLPSSQRLYALSAAQSANRDYLNAVTVKNGGSFAAIDTSQKQGTAIRALLADLPQIRIGASDGIRDAVIDTSEEAAGHIRVAARVLRDEGSIRLNVQTARLATEISIPFNDLTPRQHDLAVFWARYRIAELAAVPEHKAEVRRIGEELQVATDETSLLVLESPGDYVQYGVTPPTELKDAVGQMMALQRRSQVDLQSNHMDAMLRDLADKKAWYDAPTKAKANSKPVPIPRDEGPSSIQRPTLEPKREVPRPFSAPLPPPMPSPTFVPQNAPTGATPISSDAVPAPAARAMASPAVDQAPASLGRIRMAAKASPGEGGVDGTMPDAEGQTVIRLQAYVPDSEYGARLRGASSADLYAQYLDERPDFRNSPALYLDAADLLLKSGKRDLALRVLSNLAELDLNNRQILRVLGYRLLQAGDAETAVRIFRQVRDIAPNEPQSYRDLGQADVAAGHDQDAVDAFAEVLLKPWDGRSPEIELITLADLNALIARSDKQLDLSRIDQRLLVNMPLDVRAVLAWDADNSDLDLWVTDPRGEVCIFSNRFTAIGGRMSRDVTQGYGPEEFSLKKAIPGHYKIQVNYFGANAQLVSGVITATVRLTTGFAGKHPVEKMLTVRLHKTADRVLIGEFDIAP